MGSILIPDLIVCQFEHSAGIAELLTGDDSYKIAVQDVYYRDEPNMLVLKKIVPDDPAMLKIRFGHVVPFLRSSVFLCLCFSVSLFLDKSELPYNQDTKTPKSEETEDRKNSLICEAAAPILDRAENALKQKPTYHL